MDRDNVELPARPVPVDLRKIVESLARITETRGSQPDDPSVDVIVSVTDDVPPSVSLDETYTFRVSVLKFVSYVSLSDQRTTDSDECERYYLIRKNYLLNMLVFSCCQMRKSFAMLDISVYQFQWALPNKQ